MHSLITRILIAATLVFAGSLANATSVTELVAERAVQDLGPEMPETGYFNVLPSNDTPSDGLAIQEFWIDHQTGQFIANLVTKNGELRRISGFALLTLPVPVSNRRLQPNEIIRNEDLDIIELPWQRVSSFAILNSEALVGKQVKRMIVKGRPIHSQSVVPPIIISRGQIVKIHLNQGGLQLVTAGKAIKSAHLGQEVRVVNLSSNKTITAIARGDGVVEVESP